MSDGHDDGPRTGTIPVARGAEVRRPAEETSQRMLEAGDPRPPAAGAPAHRHMRSRNTGSPNRGLPVHRYPTGVGG